MATSSVATGTHVCCVPGGGSGREWKRVEESGRQRKIAEEWKRVDESGREWKRVEESGR
jgi:hypothetical protein